MTEWTEYKPPSRNWLENTELSKRKLGKARNEMSMAIIYSMKLDETDINKSLDIADEVIGKGKILENRLLGQVLHLRTFILTTLSHKRRPVRVVRRWDRRMAQALPNRDE